MNPTPTGTAARIHVVDDHELSRKHLGTVLRFHGYAVELSADAATARTTLLAAPPQLVLLDLQMPGESGYELLAWMRQEPTLQHIPAICVSASVPPSERERVQAAGFVAFVPKPITPPQKLLEAVRAALGPG
jgi:two-component system cell cycle response regulator DivK